MAVSHWWVFLWSNWIFHNTEAGQIFSPEKSLEEFMITWCDHCMLHAYRSRDYKLLQTFLDQKLEIYPEIYPSLSLPCRILIADLTPDNSRYIVCIVYTVYTLPPSHCRPLDFICLLMRNIFQTGHKFEHRNESYSAYGTYSNDMNFTRLFVAKQYFKP